MAAAATSLVLVEPAIAQTRTFDIAGQPATTGIQALAAATGLQIIASDTDLRGRSIAAVHGAMLPLDAVLLALRGSGLYIASNTGRTLVIKRAPDAEPVAGTTPPGDEILVTGIRQALDKSIAVRRNASGIVDAIVAEDIGKLPDQNVVESLQRIAGVQIARTQGEGSGFVIRGISQNQIQFNGAMMSGPTDNGSARLQEFNPEILAGLQVVKSPSADKTEGALGGTVNLLTKRPLDLPGFTASARVQGSYHENAEDVGNQLSGMVSASTSDKRLGLLLSYSRHEYTRNTQTFDTSGWTLVNSTANQMDTNNDGVANSADRRDIWRPIRMVNNLLEAAHERSGFNAALQFRPTPELEFTFDAAITDTVIRMDAPRLQALLTNAARDVQVDENGTVVRATYTSPTLRPANYDEDYDTRQEIYALSAKYENGPWLVELNGTHSTGKRDFVQAVPLAAPKPGLSTQIVTDFSTGSDLPTFQIIDNYDALNPANWRLLSNWETFDSTKGRNDEVRLDATLRTGGWIDRIKVGGRYQRMTLANFRHEQNPSEAQILAGYPGADRNGDGAITLDELQGVVYSGLPGRAFLKGHSGNIVRNWLAARVDIDTERAGLGLSKPPLLPASVGNTEQDQYAAYAMLGIDGRVAGLEVKGDAGVRYVQIDRTAGGYVIGNTVQYQEYKSRFRYVLPSLNLRSLVAPDLQLRLSAAKVIANPSLGAVAPSLTLNLVSFTGSRGNPDLKPFEATQADFAVEWYPAASSALTGTAFYKNISSFTVNSTVDEYFDNGVNSGVYRVTQPTNGKSGKVWGFELAYQQTFPSLPGIFANSGLSLNYTFAASDTPLVNSLDGSKDPLPGLSRHSVNASAFLEQAWGNARLTYGWRDRYLTSVQTRAAGGNLYTAAYGQLDASFQYNITDRIKLNLDLLNITGTANQTYVGYKSRPRLYEVNDRRAYFGIRANF